MRSLHVIFVVSFMCLAMFPAWAQRVSNGIPFIDAKGKSTRAGDLMVNPAAISALQQTTDSLAITGVPLITGASADFTLRPASVFTDDVKFIKIEDGGATSPITVSPKHGWVGTDPQHPGLAMFISAHSDSQLRAIILGDRQTSVTVIEPAEAGRDAYRIVPNNLPPIPICGEAPPQPPTVRRLNLSADRRDTRSTTLYDLELTLDISNDLYNQFGDSNSLLSDYLVDLFGAVNLIYNRDLNANWIINNVFVWDTNDAFAVDHPEDNNGVLTTRDQLYNYRDYIAANRGAVNFDVSQLMDTKPGLGGLAYVDVIQGNDSLPRQYRTCAINVDGTDDFPASINTYYWDTMVTAHELGHNVGSPHTHCYVPPIDCCYVEAGCSGCVTAAPAAGTIMSYCHLQFGNGGTMEMRFDQRCIDLMRPLIESSTLVSVHTDAAVMEVFGVDDVYVAPGSLAGAGSTINARIVGGPAVDKTFTITNSGEFALTLTGAPAATITGSSQISILSQPAATTLAPGASTTMAVRYNPSTPAPVTAQISIPSNAPTTPNYTFEVKGQLVEPGPPQTFTFTGNEAIPESGGFYLSVPIQVSGVQGLVSDVDVKFNGSNCADPAQTGLQHPSVGELQIKLYSPTATSKFLMYHPGFNSTPSTGDNFCNTLFDDDPGNPDIQSITPAGAPYTGTYQPDQLLSAFNGEEPNGTWYILAYDDVPGNTGSIRSVSLIIRGEQPSSAVNDWNLYR